MKNSCWLALILAFCALTMVGCKRKQVLHVYAWADYFAPEVVEEFEKKFDCVVKQDIFDSNEMMFAKLQAGGAGYDIIVPTHYFIGKMVNEKMLTSLDKAKLPNLQYLDTSVIQGLNPLVLEYAVPYFLGYTGLGYSKEALPDFEGTWDVFLNEKLRGRMTLLDDYSEIFGALSCKLGYSVDDLCDPEKGDERMEELVALALKWRPNIIKFENEQYKNGLSAGEFLAVMGYSSDLGQIVDESPETLGFVMPKEGCLMSCDTLVIPAAAPNVDLAYEFINFLYEPEMCAKNITEVHAYTPNTAAKALLDEDTLNNSSIFIAPAVLAKSAFVPELSPEQEARFLKYWNRIKAGE
ncbi:MAG: spermidine/putrescine ABC transporter substrate-binding protein [Lentisphaeria bacterium]|nr:spermidine/putrescine ABC transporter substrate-binding protein [Lentisphaeria bacterium]